jgi:hypothetical protein
MNMNKTLKIVGVTAVVLVAFIAGFAARPLYVSYHDNQVTDPAKTFVAALTSGDAAKAYTLASDNVHKGQTQDQFVQSVGDLKSSDPQYSNETLSVDKNKATYVVLAHNVPADGLGSTTAQIQLGLTKQAGNWVVDSVGIQ